MYATVAFRFFFKVHYNFDIFLSFFSPDLPERPERIIIYIYIYFCEGVEGFGRQHIQGLPDAEA